MNYNIKNLIEIKQDRRAKDKRYFMSAKRARKILNWKNMSSLDKGLDRTIDTFTQIYKDNIKLSLIYKHKK